LTEGAYVYHRIVQFVPANKQKLDILFQGLKSCNSTNTFLLDSFQKSGLEISQEKVISLKDWKYFEEFKLKFSHGIEAKEWLQSLLSQPDLFIRLRKNEITNLEKIKNSELYKP